MKIRYRVFKIVVNDELIKIYPDFDLEETAKEFVAGLLAERLYKNWHFTILPIYSNS
jgi:hypothetical protein